MGCVLLKQITHYLSILCIVFVRRILFVMGTYAYNILISENDPRAGNPPRVLTPLKPHQQAGLYKAIHMETFGSVEYDIENPEDYLHSVTRHFHAHTMLRGNVSVKTNTGIMGDIVGFGKTLMALALIAENPVANIARDTHIVRSVNAHNRAMFTATMTRNVIDNNYIHTTLVVVPRGPVFVQWEQAIRTQTNLSVLALDSLPTIRKLMPSPHTSTREDIKRYLETFDVVLVKNTSFTTLMDFYSNMSYALGSWDRVMIDEAHDIVGKTPLVKFHFLWLISATYPMLLSSGYGSRNNMLYAVRDLFIEEYMNMILVKSTREFTQQSFAIPQPVEHYYICKFDRRLAAVQPFLSATVQERLNANDIRGAVVELGGSAHTEDDIVDLVTKDLKRDIHNKEIEANMIASLMLPDDVKEARTISINNELQRLREKLEAIIERVTMLEDKSCPICYDQYTDPIVLDCTHVFCGSCLISWMKNAEVCPTCRKTITTGNLRTIVSSSAINAINALGQPSMQPPVMKSKEDKVIDIIHDNPDGKFLIFSKIDTGFYKIIEKLMTANVSYVEMKGSTSHMMHALNNFREGRVKVCLLSTYHAGSGIDISCATDVILLHSMGSERDQAVGRAQRQGRTTQLHIHSLLYPHEASASSASLV